MVGAGCRGGEGKGCVGGGGAWRRKGGVKRGEGMNQDQPHTVDTEPAFSPLVRLSRSPIFLLPSPISIPIFQPVGLDEGGLCMVLSELGAWQGV